MRSGIFCRSKTKFIASINILQHSNSIPEKSQRKAENNQDPTLANDLFLLIVICPSGYSAKLSLGRKIMSQKEEKKKSNFEGNSKRKLKDMKINKK